MKAAAFSPVSGMLFVVRGGEEAEVEIWDINSNFKIGSIYTEISEVSDISIPNNGKRIVIAQAGGNHIFLYKIPVNGRGC